jgi:GT2 family glycosyltransferase
MGSPKVSVLWLNYNSIHVIQTTLRSLDALASLDYPNLELILVDNGSTDGSREAIEKHLQTPAMKKHKTAFLALKQNLGWTGGVNAAYRARDKQAKYVALTHNDVLPNPDYLRKLVDYMESYGDVGAVQGVVYRLGNGKVDSSGFLITESLGMLAIHENTNFSLKKPLTLSYVEGAMPVYRIEALTKALKNSNNLFVEGAFMYYLEDVFVSLALWNAGYKSLILPVNSGLHQRMAVSRQHVESTQLYHYRLRNQIALLYMTNSADKLRVILQNLRRGILSRGSWAFRQMMLRSVIEGVEMGQSLRRQYGKIDLYKTPMKKTSVKGRLRL